MIYFKKKIRKLDKYIDKNERKYTKLEVNVFKKCYKLLKKLVYWIEVTEKYKMRKI